MLDTLTKRRLTGVVTDRAAAHLRTFRRDAEQALPGKVTGVVLFGSRARGDARRGSDYDVAVFIRELDDRRAIDHTLADMAYSHILAGFHIRPVAIPADYLTTSPRNSFAIELLRDESSYREGPREGSARSKKETRHQTSPPPCRTVVRPRAWNQSTTGIREGLDPLDRGRADSRVGQRTKCLRALSLLRDAPLCGRSLRLAGLVRVRDAPPSHEHIIQHYGNWLRPSRAF